MKDSMGNPLSVGDNVAYAYGEGKTLRIGKITNIYKDGKKCSVDGNPNVLAKRILKLNSKNTQAIMAMEQDGPYFNIICIVCNILSDEPLDLKAAVKEAVMEYLHTEEGSMVYKHNCGCFNWADFEMHVPNDICRNHGFEKLVTYPKDILVDLGEHLADWMPVKEKEEP